MLTSMHSEVMYTMTAGKKRDSQDPRIIIPSDQTINCCAVSIHLTEIKRGRDFVFAASGVSYFIGSQQPQTLPLTRQKATLYIQLTSVSGWFEITNTTT